MRELFEVMALPAGAVPTLAVRVKSADTDRTGRFEIPLAGLTLALDGLRKK
jgi:hypothetical protein